MTSEEIRALETQMRSLLEIAENKKAAGQPGSALPYEVHAHEIEQIILADFKRPV